MGPEHLEGPWSCCVRLVAQVVQGLWYLHIPEARTPRDNCSRRTPLCVLVVFDDFLDDPLEVKRLLNSLFELLKASLLEVFVQGIGILEAAGEFLDKFGEALY